ncbi:MAG: hypothetical protein B7X93_11070 [Hydrogenophilales bacterium 17-61-9]|nr:MAG: hypothetical protein B7X93_11070 [Hydrogenophilales bacterium 17-61-9]
MSPELASVLKLARWAPSGDNTQPWRFRLLGENAIEVLYRPSDSLGVFNLDHFAGHLAMGALLESLDVAASAHGWEMEASHKAEPDTASFSVRFKPANRPPSALLPFLESRVTQRRALSWSRLSAEEKRSLETSVGKFYSLIWVEDWPAKTRLAKLLGLIDKIRLTIPEAYEVHRDTIAWGTRFSEDRIPDAAIAVDPLLIRVMRWAMKSWPRVQVLNRFLWGHGLPRLEMDVIPALFCGAHCLLMANQLVTSTQEGVEAGRSMQRLWLTATSLGLQAQPEMAPVIFSRYAAQNRAFTVNTKGWSQAQQLTQRFALLFGDDRWNRTAFMMRLGAGKAPQARSLRKPLADLIES